MIEVLGSRVVVKEAAATTVSAGGIVIPDVGQQKAYRGEVVAVGPGIIDNNGRLRPVGLKVGDKVAFAKFAGATIETDDKEEYVIINERDILAVL